MISFERLIQDKNSFQQATESSPNGNFHMNLQQTKKEYWKMREKSNETAENLHKLIQITRKKRENLEQIRIDIDVRKQILLFNFHKNAQKWLDKFTDIQKEQRGTVL